jgi:hypothetical protein
VDAIAALGWRVADQRRSRRARLVGALWGWPEDRLAAARLRAARRWIEQLPVLIDGHRHGRAAGRAAGKAQPMIAMQLADGYGLVQDLARSVAGEPEAEQQHGVSWAHVLLHYTLY